LKHNKTKHINVTPTSEALPPKKTTPPTERIPADGGSESKTVRIVPGETPQFDEPMNDKLFDQYTIYSKIGNGGMGVVYLARDRRLGRFVAIKRLNHQAQSNPSLRQRFLQEARAVATLSHVHIVHIYALGEDDDGPFIVMEYVAGPDDPSVKQEQPVGGLVQPNPPLTLDQLVQRHGPMTADEATEIILKIGRAVAYAHSCGVIHRDLKPSNILLDKSNEPKIVDFGLARLMHKDEAKLTVPGEKLLSLGYGAPEQEDDASKSDERADVYGLGALLYFTLTGQNPRYFREQDVPVSLRDVVVKALATDRDQRFPSANAFNEALHNVQTKTRVETPTVKTTWRCKWCDAINPLTTKFCAECGWDGSEVCPECGAETFVGIQYCGNCGADTRAYESILLLIKKMQEAMEQQRYERVITYAGRVHGFEPAGPSGRRYLADIAALRKSAETNLKKCAQLQEQIPIELRAENYERAEAFIHQLRQISEDKHVFEAEEKELPQKTLARDLLRAQKAVKNREWGKASQICEDLLSTVAPDNPDVLAIRRGIYRHTLFSDVSTACCIFISIVLVYLLSLPVVARLTTPPFGKVMRLFYKPGMLAYTVSGIEKPLGAYARWTLPQGRALTDWYSTESLAQDPEVPTDIKIPASMKQKQDEYTRQSQEIVDAKKDFEKAWPKEYSQELTRLMEQRRTAGDFEGWEVVKNEYTRFLETRSLPVASSDSTSPELSALQNKYRQMMADQKVLTNRKLVTLCKKYVNDLSDIQKTFMQEGKMDLASAVNAEIRSAKSAQEQLEAESASSIVPVASVAGDGTVSVPELISPANVTTNGEIKTMRDAFEAGLSKLEKEDTKKNTEWQEQYLAKLNELMESYQRAGDFGGWENVRNEASRFEADRNLSQQDIVQESPKLADLQEFYIQARYNIHRARSEQLVADTEKYIKQLQDMQKKLTVDGQMDAAASVNAELRRIKSRHDYTAALTDLAPEGPPVPPNLLK
jgi:serine/threonine protein kinase